MTPPIPTPSEPVRPSEIRLSPRQVTVLRNIAAGRTLAATVALLVDATEAQVKSDLRHLHAQFGARTRPHLITQAFRYGWLRVERRSTGDVLVTERPSAQVRDRL